jgi:hypothetical protein
MRLRCANRTYGPTRIRKTRKQQEPRRPRLIRPCLTTRYSVLHRVT